MKKKAFITGINGQDGSYLSEHLLNLDYEVFGIVRRNSIAEQQESRIDHLVDNGVNTEYGDLLDSSSLERMIRSIRPDEIYNIAAAILYISSGLILLIILSKELESKRSPYSVFTPLSTK